MRCARAVLLLAAFCLVCGCTTRRARLTEERSALLREKDALQQPWQPQSAKEVSKRNLDNAEEPVSREEQMKKIDQRVAEIDAELLQPK